MDIEPIRGAVTPHSLRRTYISLMLAAGHDVPYVMEQAGHTDPSVTLGIYAKAIRRRSRLTGAYLAEFDKALDWAQMGTTPLPVPMKFPQMAC